MWGFNVREGKEGYCKTVATFREEKINVNGVGLK
jgi:hypothetical protein